MEEGFYFKLVKFPFAIKNKQIPREENKPGDQKLIYRILLGVKSELGKVLL